MNMLTKQQILLLHTQLIRQSVGTDISNVRNEVFPAPGLW